MNVPPPELLPTSVALGPDHYAPFTVELECARNVDVGRTADHRVRVDGSLGAEMVTTAEPPIAWH